MEHGGGAERAPFERQILGARCRSAVCARAGDTHRPRERPAGHRPRYPTRRSSDLPDTRRRGGTGHRSQSSGRGVSGTPHGLWCAAVTWTLAAKRCVEGSERDAPRFMCAICLCGSAVAALGMYLIGDRPSAGGRGGGGIRGSPRCLPSLLRSPSSRSEVV